MDKNKLTIKHTPYGKPTLNDYANKILQDDKFGEIEKFEIDNKTKTIKVTSNNGGNRIVQNITVNPIGTIGTTTNYPENMSTLELKEAIKELRTQHMTQIQIADKLGISQSYISKLENE
jgi:hypothetical protein